MKRFKLCIAASLIITLAMFAMASTALAVCSTSPAQPAGEAPYGLNVQGAASGTKLSGVLEISFTNIHCAAAYEATRGICYDKRGNWINGPNAAMARAAMRLSRTNTNGTTSTQAFYVDLGEVPYFDAQAVQATALEKLRPHILNAFFGGDFGQNIYLKEFTLYSQANISTAPPDDRFSEFTAIANLTLAVN